MHFLSAAPITRTHFRRPVVFCTLTSNHLKSCVSPQLVSCVWSWSLKKRKRNKRNGRRKRRGERRRHKSTSSSPLLSPFSLTSSHFFTQFCLWFPGILTFFSVWPSCLFPPPFSLNFLSSASFYFLAFYFLFPFLIQFFIPFHPFLFFCFSLFSLPFHYIFFSFHFYFCLLLFLFLPPPLFSFCFTCSEFPFILVLPFLPLFLSAPFLVLSPSSFFSSFHLSPDLSIPFVHFLSFLTSSALLSFFLLFSSPSPSFFFPPH